MPLAGWTRLSVLELTGAGHHSAFYCRLALAELHLVCEQRDAGGFDTLA